MTITGALIMTLFGTVWWVVGLRSAGHDAALVYALPSVVATVLGAVAWRLARRESPARGKSVV